MPGVVAVLTGEDLLADWQTPLPCAWPVTDDMKNPPHCPLAVGEACFAGDGVAVVVAESQEAARDGIEAVVVEYEELPAAVDLADAATDRVLAHPELGTNASYTWELIPDPAAIDARVRRGRAHGARAVRATAAHPVGDGDARRVRRPRALRRRLHDLLVDPDPAHPEDPARDHRWGSRSTSCRVVAPSVGGGFGSKLNVYAEEVICLTLARRLSRPMRWVEERGEATQATIQGRGQIQEIELAADGDGRITAVRVRIVADMGAYLQLVTPGIPLLGAFIYHGVYDIPAYSFSCTGVFTNLTPTDAYRGAGRPEATYAIECAIEALARETGIDPIEIRRRNFIAADQFPFTTSAGLEYDSGNYPRALDQALEMAGYDGLRAEQEARRARGDTVQLGIGISVYVEMCGLAPSRLLGQLNFGAGGWEHGVVRVLPTGMVEVITGTAPHGQGHETCWSMIVADQLGIPEDHVEVLHSDTADLASRARHLRLAFTRGRRERDLRGVREGHRQGRQDRRPPDGGGGGRSRVRGGELPGEGQPRDRDVDPGDRVRGVHRPRSARGPRAQPHRRGLLRPAELHLPVRRAHRGRRRRHRDRRTCGSSVTSRSTTAATR